MKEFRIDFSGKSTQYTEEEINSAVHAMRFADPLTQGKYQAEFEDAFSRYNGSKNCFAVSNGTAALELAAILCRLAPGDEVIIPAHTFCATAIPFARTGAKIVWADIDPGTLVVSAATIASRITDKTKVIVVVHLYGLMAPMDEIMALARHKNLLVVEDCAQSIGASLHGIKAGNYGDFACFSFHTHKNMTTLGEGGMLVVRDDECAKLVPGLRHNGLRGFDPDREHYWIPAMSNVDFDIDTFWPYNFCMGEVQCAVGIKLLERIDSLNRDRNERAARFIDALSDFPELTFQKVPEGHFSSYHLLPASYNSGNSATRDDFIGMMAFTCGIKLVVQYCPLYRYPMFKKAGFGDAECPVSDRFFDTMVSFPFHHWLPEEDFEYMIQSTIHTLDWLRK
ncbi:MAG: hypothetical protein APR53_03260 [Methanoculleus sp. SDB]|nr:MAG: hypothetical protein APR53_03260 [Methanoculleus sp. SDB]